MKDFLALAKTRYSVRKFSPKKIEKDKMNLILEAGRVAPTAHNNQPQRILVLQSDDALAKLKECTSSHFSAPLALIICYDKNVQWVHRDYPDVKMGVVDASIVTTHMMLQAAEIGVGSTWVAYYDIAKLREIFAIPEDFADVAILTLGYPAEKSKPSVLHEDRLPTEQTVFYEKY